MHRQPEATAPAQNHHQHPTPAPCLWDLRIAVAVREWLWRLPSEFGYDQALQVAEKHCWGTRWGVAEIWDRWKYRAIQADGVQRSLTGGHELRRFGNGIPPLLHSGRFLLFSQGKWLVNNCLKVCTQCVLYLPTNWRRYSRSFRLVRLTGKKGNPLRHRKEKKLYVRFLFAKQVEFESKPGLLRCRDCGGSKLILPTSRNGLCESIVFFIRFISARARKRLRTCIKTIRTT